MIEKLMYFWNLLFHTNEKSSANKTLVSVAIDKYPSSWNCDLRYCIKGQKRIAKKCEDYGFNRFALLKNSEATWTNLCQAILKTFETGKKGDTLIIHHSHHGLQVPDLNGDEADGYDEAILLYADKINNGIITDDQYGELLDQAPEGMKILVIFDCCHSDTGTRGEGDSNSKSILFKKVRGRLRRQMLRHKPNALRWSVWSACDADKTTMDMAKDFTYWLCKTIRRGQTLRKWRNRIEDSLLVTYYRQTPHAEGDMNEIFFN